MNKRKPAKGFLWAVALAPFLFTACVDDSYDLTKDIDLTITIGGNLSIPGSETEEFTLEDILDLEENSVIKADSLGNYALNKADTTNTEVDIDPVRIDAPDTRSSDEYLTFTFPTSGYPGKLVGTVDETYSMSFTYEKDDVTEDIVSLTSATVDFEAYLILGFFTGNENVEDITFENGFTVELEMEGQDDDRDAIEFELLDKKNYTIAAPQTISFLYDQTVEKNSALRIPVRFTEIRNFPEGQGLDTIGHFQLKVNVIPNGTVTTEDLGMGDITVTFVHDAEVPEFTLQTVTGIIDPEIDVDVDPVTLNDVPDFLKDNDVNLDLANPYIKLRVENGSPADINFKGRLTWVKNNEREGFEIGTALGTDIAGQTIIIEGDATSEYYLSRTGVEGIDQRHNIIVGDSLYYMIRDIPEEIELINVEAKAVQEEITVELGDNGAHYEVNTIYELDAALRFGDEAYIIYTDTLDDWSSDLEDITIKKAVVEMTALNGIPLNFTVDAQPIDRNGNVYSNVTVTPVENTILPGLKLANGDESATESSIQLELTCEGGDMSELDGIIITFTANMEGVDENLKVTLNKGMTLQLSNIRIRIENGITLDLN